MMPLGIVRMRGSALLRLLESSMVAIEVGLEVQLEETASVTGVQAIVAWSQEWMICAKP